MCTQEELDLGNEALSLLAQMWGARHKPVWFAGTPDYIFQGDFDHIMRESSQRLQRALADWEKSK